MRVVAITRIRDEDDIVEAFVRHTAPFVAHHIFMDDGSVDRTQDILRALKAEGYPLTVLQSQAVTFNESDALTIMYRLACLAHQADWVLCLDADEFIDDRQVEEGLLSYLAAQTHRSDEFDYIHVPMVNYILTAKDSPNEINIPLRMTYRREPADACKVIMRGSLEAEEVWIRHGAHTAIYRGADAKPLLEPRLRLAHYTVRSAYQHMVKFIRGWNKVLATGEAEIARETAWHYKSPYALLRDHPEALLLNKAHMNPPPEGALQRDPIRYAGKPLKYTLRRPEAMHAVRCLMGYVEQLSRQHGALLDKFPEAREHVRAAEAAFREAI
jgi:glycosyltransferase involved in cell wall biosynthesis